MHPADKQNKTIIKRIPESFRSIKNLNTGSLSLFFNGDNILLNHVGVLKHIISKTENEQPKYYHNYYIIICCRQYAAWLVQLERRVITDQVCYWSGRQSHHQQRWSTGRWACVDRVVHAWSLEWVCMDQMIEGATAPPGDCPNRHTASSPYFHDSALSSEIIFGEVCFSCSSLFHSRYGWHGLTLEEEEGVVSMVLLHVTPRWPYYTSNM